jgi:hypothetical protein
MNVSLIKLEPTNLYLYLDINADEKPIVFWTKVVNIEGYKYLGTYCEYELNFDVKPFIKESVIKQIKVLDRLPENCTHFYDYADNEYSYMFDEGHSLQSLLEINEVEFDEDINYKLYTK